MALGEGDRTGSGSPYAFRTTVEDRSPLNDNMSLLGEGHQDSRGSAQCRRYFRISLGDRRSQAFPSPLFSPFFGMGAYIIIQLRLYFPSSFGLLLRLW